MLYVYVNNNKSCLMEKFLKLEFLQKRNKIMLINMVQEMWKNKFKT